MTRRKYPFSVGNMIVFLLSFTIYNATLSEGPRNIQNRSETCGRPTQVYSFFKLFGLGQGLAKFLLACAEHVDNCRRNSFACGKISLLTPYFWLFHKRLSIPYRLASRAAARLAHPTVRPWEYRINPVTSQSPSTIHKADIYRKIVATVNHSASPLEVTIKQNYTIYVPDSKLHRPTTNLWKFSPNECRINGQK
jgi:hypothetical protein